MFVDLGAGVVRRHPPHVLSHLRHRVDFSGGVHDVVLDHHLTLGMLVGQRRILAEGPNGRLEFFVGQLVAEMVLFAAVVGVVHLDVTVGQKQHTPDRKESLRSGRGDRFPGPGYNGAEAETERQPDQQPLSRRHVNLRWFQSLNPNPNGSGDCRWRGMCGQRSQGGLQAGFDPGGLGEATRQTAIRP